MPYHNQIYRELTDDGKPDGDPEMNVNGSVTPVPYFIAPAVNGDDIYLITRLVVHYEDNGTWSSEKFGSIAGGLTNGIKVAIQNAAGDTDKVLLTSLHTVKANSNWSGVCYDSKIESVGAGNSFLSARWSFFKDTEGAGLYLHSDDRLAFIVDDDLSSLVEMSVHVRGQIIQ